MNPWPKHPVIYEINTWVWLNELSRKYERPVTLAAVPSEEWDYLSSFGADAVWFMGIWERSPAGTAIANQNKGLLEDFRPGFYRTLLKAASLEGMRNGHWQLCERTGWPENASYQNLVAWCWRNAGEHHLIVVNLSDSGAQGQVRLPWDELRGKSWKMTDLFTGQMYERSGKELCNPGMYVDLPPWGFHVLTRWLPIG